jgi:hypothetical protein
MKAVKAMRTCVSRYFVARGRCLDASCCYYRPAHTPTSRVVPAATSMALESHQQVCNTRCRAMSRDPYSVAVIVVRLLVVCVEGVVASGALLRRIRYHCRSLQACLPLVVGLVASMSSLYRNKTSAWCAHQRIVWATARDSQPVAANRSRTTAQQGACSDVHTRRSRWSIPRRHVVARERARYKHEPSQRDVRKNVIIPSPTPPTTAKVPRTLVPIWSTRSWLIHTTCPGSSARCRLCIEPRPTMCVALLTSNVTWPPVLCCSQPVRIGSTLLHHHEAHKPFRSNDDSRAEH